MSCCVAVVLACSVLIERKNLAQAGTIINLTELRLFNISGAQIPSSQLSVTMSSTMNPYYAANCIDGRDTSSTTTPNVCSTTAGGSSPWLRINHSCSVLPLSRLQVTNRHDCCRDRITAFRMRFLNAAGGEWRSAFGFNSVQATYTVMLAAP